MLCYSYFLVEGTVSDKMASIKKTTRYKIRGSLGKLAYFLKYVFWRTLFKL